MSSDKITRSLDALSGTGDEEQSRVRKIVGVAIVIAIVIVYVLTSDATTTLHPSHRMALPSAITSVAPNAGKQAVKSNMGKETQWKLVDLMETCMALLRQSGVEIMAIRSRAKGIGAKSKGKTDEGADDPVTDADMSSHRIIVNQLGKLIPQLKPRIVSEEKEEIPANAPVTPTRVMIASADHLPRNISRDIMVDLANITIWVDPLDATKEYSEGLLRYVTVMICIADGNGRPLAGMIHQPLTQRTDWAIVGVDASDATLTPEQQILVDKDIADETQRSAADKAVKDNSGLEEQQIEGASGTMIISRSHPGKVAELAKLLHVKKVVPAGGAGFKALSVLRGDADFYVHSTKIKKWDFCAGDAVLTAAGSGMTDWQGKRFNYDVASEVSNKKGLIATSSKKQHDRLAPLLKTAKVG